MKNDMRAEHERRLDFMQQMIEPTTPGDWMWAWSNDRFYIITHGSPIRFVETLYRHDAEFIAQAHDKVMPIIEESRRRGRMLNEALAIIERLATGGDVDREEIERFRAVAIEEYDTFAGPAAPANLDTPDEVSSDG